MTAALVLAGTPSPARLLAAFQRATVLVPRLRQRVVPPLLPVGPPAWVDDAEFDLDRHVRRVVWPDAPDLSAVLAAASASATSRLDPARPLWDAVMVEGLRDGRAVLLLRVHHTLADGVRAVQMLAGLLDLEPEPGHTALPPPADGPRATPSSLLMERLVRAPRDAFAAAPGRAVDAAVTAWRLAVRPGDLVADGLDYLSSVTRLFSTSGAEPSPLLRARSRDRRFAALDVPLAPLREAARAAGGTVNDAFLTAVLGGLARYSLARGAAPRDVPLALPVTVRADPGDPAGNAFSAAVIAGPASVADPAERLRRVHDLVVGRRAEPGLDVVGRLAPVLQAAPSWLAAGGLLLHGRRVDVQASNLAGPAFTTYLAGQRVERVYPLGPAPGIPLMAVLLSYDGTCCVGLTLDPAAVVSGDELVDCIRQGFDEVLDGAATAQVVGWPGT
jgi:WS/DGAT/MGAT family acyltransferase